MIAVDKSLPTKRRKKASFFLECKKEKKGEIYVQKFLGHVTNQRKEVGLFKEQTDQKGEDGLMRKTTFAGTKTPPMNRRTHDVPNGNQRNRVSKESTQRAYLALKLANASGECGLPLPMPTKSLLSWLTCLAPALACSCCCGGGAEPKGFMLPLPTGIVTLLCGTCIC